MTHLTQIELELLVSEKPALKLQIEQSIEKIMGWCSVPKARTLAGLVLKLRAAHVAEIGIFAGRSLLPMALALKALGRGQVVGIDPYEASESVKNESPENEKWWGSVDHKKIKLEFLKLIQTFRLELNVRLIEKTSDEADVSNMIFDLVHVDGSHTRQALADAKKFGPLVPVGGVMVLDDLFWTGGGPLLALDELKSQGFEECFRVVKDSDNWCVMRKMK